MPVSCLPRDASNDLLSATLGGYILKDSLWFFLAGSDTSRSDPSTFLLTGDPRPDDFDNRRYEIKLTGNIGGSHTLEGLTLRNSSDLAFSLFGIEPRTLDSTSVDHEYVAFRYTGVLGSRLLVEARYSDREVLNTGIDGSSTEIRDSPFYDPPSLFAGGDFFYNAPVFDEADPSLNFDDQNLSPSFPTLFPRKRPAVTICGAGWSASPPPSGEGTRRPRAALSSGRHIRGTLRASRSSTRRADCYRCSSPSRPRPTTSMSAAPTPSFSSRSPPRETSPGSTTSMSVHRAPASISRRGSISTTMWSTTPPSRRSIPSSSRESGCPRASEISLSGAMQLPGGGSVEATLIDREFRDAFEDFIEIGNGTSVIDTPSGPFVADNIVFRNTNQSKRDYLALQVQGRHRFSPAWTLDGHWTWEIDNDGNFIGENFGNPALPSVIGDRPELQAPDRNYPVGALPSHLEHKLRVWTNYGLRFGKAGDLDLTLLFRYDSPLTYSHTARIPLTDIQRSRDPGYASPPFGQVIYFDGRGTDTFDALQAFDLVSMYQIPVSRSAEPWIKITVRNLFNSTPKRTWDIGVAADFEGPVDANGIPTEFIRSPTYREALSPSDYYPGREFLVSLGIRF